MTIQLRYRVFAALLLALSALSPGNSLAQGDSTGSDTKVDCAGWVAMAPLDRQNFGDDFALKWKDYLRRDARSDQLNIALHCLADHLVELKKSLEGQTQTIAGGQYLNDVEGRLENLGRDLLEIHRSLKELSAWMYKSERVRKAGGNSTVEFNASLSSELRAMIAQQLKVSEILIEKLGVNKDPSWIVFNSTGGIGKTDDEGSEATGQQVNAAEEVRTLFPDASSIHFAIATVADPRVPRHRRLYDNAITAMSHGLLTHGYVLDRYEFPWQNALKPQSAADESSLLRLVSDDARFGLMIFRRDVWRYEGDATARMKPTTEIRALYVVPETATYGIQSAAFGKALRKIAAQLCAHGRSSERLPVFGPTFSGSVDSIVREWVKWTSSSIPVPPCRGVSGLDVVSASATASSNRLINLRALSPSTFSALTQSDANKLDALDQLRTVLGVPEKSPAFLYESSVFGFDACQGGSPPKVCIGAQKIPFPANIADVRFGIRKREAERARVRSTPIMPTTRLPHLSLEDGAENGSEFPESFQSPLTAVANQLDLDAAVASLDRTKSRIAVIIATDVRDRLFLFEQLRSQLENTLLFDLETDRLLAHPDVMNVTRGAMTLASAEITSAGGAWSTDHQAILESQFCNWSQVWESRGREKRDCDAALEFQDRPAASGVHLHVVSRNGLVSASQAAKSCTNDLRCKSGFSLAAPTFTIVFCVFLTWMWGWRPEANNQDRLFQRCLNKRLWALVPLVLPLAIVQPSGRPMLLLIIVGIVGFTFSLYRIYSGIAFSMQPVFDAHRGLRTEWSWRALPWCAALIILLIAVIQLWNMMLIPWAVVEDFSIAHQVHALQIALTGNTGGGLAYGMALSVVAGALLYAFAASKAYSAAGHRNQFVRGDEIYKDDSHSTASIHTDELLVKARTWIHSCYLTIREGGCVWVMVSIGGITALGVIAHEVVVKTGTRLTVFGNSASITIYLGLLAVTLTGAIMFVSALWVVSQINLVRARLEGVFRGFRWDISRASVPKFAVTPIFSTTEQQSPGISALVTAPQNWRQQLAALLGSTQAASVSSPATNESWLAPAALLSSYMMIYRWAVIGVLISALAAAGIVYLFPVSDSDGLLLFNLALLLGIGLHSAFITVRFESCEILSMVLCNREKETSLSTGLFAFIAFPFVALAIAVAIAQIPGVLNWGDGIFDLLIKLTQPSILR